MAKSWMFVNFPSLAQHSLTFISLTWQKEKRAKLTMGETL